MKPERLYTMKITVKLTADELLDVLEAVEQEAYELGMEVLDEDFNPVNETCSELFDLLDTALTTMGVEIEEDVEGDVYEWEEDDEDEDDDEWDEYEEEEDEDEDEDEDEEEDPIKRMIYRNEDGSPVIRESDARRLLRLICNSIEAVEKERGKIYSYDEKVEAVQNIMMHIAKVYGIWGVDMGK